MTSEELAAIRGRLKDASKIDWCGYNMQFIDNAQNDIEALLAEVERQRQLIIDFYGNRSDATARLIQRCKDQEVEIDQLKQSAAKGGRVFDE